MSPRSIDTLLGSITLLREAYLTDAVRPEAVIERVYERIESTRSVFISVRPRSDVLSEVARSEARRRSLPLFGVPFGVKDNVDVAGSPTTCACPAFARVPERSSYVVDRLVAAGAVVVGKTNLDQFATGISGTRSPYGIPANAYDESLIPGGSSSGSAVAVARGLVTFALGTDTGGSGRVPAGLNGVVGLKPSRGLLSLRGVFPNCPSLDCVSLFARNVADAALLLDLARGYDAEDPWSSPDAGVEVPAREGHLRFGVLPPEQREFFGDAAQARAYEMALEQIRAAGGETAAIDFAPYFEAGRLLFEGPWIAERYASFGAFVEAHPEDVLPVLRDVLEPARRHSAVDVFRAQHRLAALRRVVQRDFENVDLLAVPTAPTVYRLDEHRKNPVELNRRMGTYSYFGNLLDLSAISVPVSSYPSGAPIGVSIYGARNAERTLIAAAKRYLRPS